MKPSPLIFLDVDGVLNTSRFLLDQRPVYLDAPDDVARGAAALMPEAVGLLSGIVEKTGARIVFSSSWRYGTSRAQFFRMLRLRGYSGPPLVGSTPVFMGHECRGAEIEAWLAEHRKRRPPFVILDDRDDMEPNMDRLILTDGRVGLTAKLADRAVSMLG